MVLYIYIISLTHTHMQKHFVQFHEKHNIRPYTMLLLGLFAVTNNALAAAQLVQF